MPKPVLLLMASEVVIVEVKGPENEAKQTVPVRHVWLKPVIEAPVPL
jgi:hypothetical protein